MNIQAVLEEYGRNFLISTHELLMVRAWLYSPISFDVIGRMPLDDILCVAVLRHAGIHIDDLGPMDPRPVQIPAPLQIRWISDDWYYATSQASFLDPIEVVRSKRKHFKDSRFVAPSVVDTRSGKFRSYDLKTQAVSSPFVQWDVCGSRHWLKQLLPLIGSLGKGRNTGLGTVLSWEIAETDQDPCVIDGVPRRAIPCRDGNVSAYQSGSFALAHRTFRPPYVWPGGRTQCVVPIGGHQ
jgi:hypothetical protein